MSILKEGDSNEVALQNVNTTCYDATIDKLNQVLHCATDPKSREYAIRNIQQHLSEVAENDIEERRKHLGIRAQNHTVDSGFGMTTISRRTRQSSINYHSMLRRHEYDTGPTEFRRGRGTSRVPIDPVSGNIYCTYWEKSRQYFAVLCLPVENTEWTAIGASLETLGLLLPDSIPICYDYDAQSRTLSWKQGEGEDGAGSSTRQFPVMYFDGLPFPEKSAVGWVPATNLQVYDDLARNLVQYDQQVQEFIKSQRSWSGFCVER